MQYETEIGTKMFLIYFLESKAEAFHKSKESPNSGMNGRGSVITFFITGLVGFFFFNNFLKNQIGFLKNPNTKNSKHKESPTINFIVEVIPP